MGDYRTIAGRNRALALKAMTLPTAVCDKRLLAVLSRRRECGAVSQNQAGSDENKSVPHRGCVQTLSKAGWPDLTTATASLTAGARSAGSLIGPFAHQPIDSASLWYSMSGFIILVPIGPRSLPTLAVRTRKLASRCTCITSW